MLATGKLPPDAIPGGLANQDCLLGMEFSGLDSAGNRVMGLVPAKVRHFNLEIFCLKRNSAILGFRTRQTKNRWYNHSKWPLVCNLQIRLL